VGSLYAKEFGNLICEQICQEAGESRPGWEAGAAFVLASPVVVSAVAAHDGGVRLICAGWVPQDDDSDANVTAVYKRASLMICVESHCGS
jgi:hypothetical protein